MLYNCGYWIYLDKIWIMFGYEYIYVGTCTVSTVQGSTTCLLLQASADASKGCTLIYWVNCRVINVIIKKKI